MSAGLRMMVSRIKCDAGLELGCDFQELFASLVIPYSYLSSYVVPKKLECYHASPSLGKLGDEGLMRGKLF